jgi:hypothetical protein
MYDEKKQNLMLNLSKYIRESPRENGDNARKGVKPGFW